MKNNWSHSFNLPPLLLTRNDFVALSREIFNSNKKILTTNEINLISGAKEISVANFEELLQTPDLPSDIDGIDIFCFFRERDQNETLIGTVALTLGRHYADCRVTSSDEEWFRGKREKIKNFFKLREPRYSFISRIFPYLIGFIVPIPGLYAAFLFGSRQYSKAVNYLVIFIFSLWLVYLYFRNRLFPYIKIVLDDPEVINKKNFFNKWWFQQLVAPVAVILGGGFIMSFLSNAPTQAEKKEREDEAVLKETFINSPEKEASSNTKMDELTPSGIMSKIDETIPAQRKEAARSFIGIKVEWPGYLRSVKLNKKNDLALVILSEKNGLLLREQFYFIVSLREYPELKILPEDSVIRVSGEIEEIDLLIKLTNVKLFLKNKSG